MYGRRQGFYKGRRYGYGYGRQASSSSYSARSSYRAPRSYRSRDSSDGGWSGVPTRTIARQAARVASRALAIETATKQLYKVSDEFVIALDTLYSAPLNLVEEGGGEGERIGENVMGCGLHIKGVCSPYSAPSELPYTRRVRIIVTLSQLVNGTHTFTADEILEPTGLGTGTWDLALYNRDRVGTVVKILADRLISISDQKMDQNFDILVPVPYRTTFVNAIGKDAAYQNVIHIHAFPVHPIGLTEGPMSVKWSSNYTYFTA